ncbi:MAG TPA: class I adenylate-forming enzyme family protein [Pseudobdellovibrionaceae bacterium]|jgi:acyl-CoA synthetase (AMP-forming)/AMP-acid ligase II
MSDTLKGRILSTLQRFPKNVLLEDDGCSWTGEQLSSHLQSIVTRIEIQSLPHSRVGVCFHNSASQAIAILAILMSDRVPVMINGVDLLESKINWIHHAKLNFGIVSEDFAEKIDIPHLVINEQGLPVELIGKTNVSAEVDQVLHMPPAGTGLVLFTSGSTGEMKEVYIPALGILKTIDELIKKFNLSEKTVATVTLPVCHSMALNTQFLPTFMVGGKCHFCNLRLSMNKVYRGLLRDNSTFVALIGEIVRTCWEERRLKKLPPCDQVEHVQIAGGLISLKHLEMTRELFPKAIIHKGYGLTEAIRVTMISSQEEKFNSTAVGKPLSFLELQIRNEHGEILPAGQYGEIHVKGDSVMLGLRSLTSANSRLVAREEFLATGDLGMMDEEGYLHVTGRLDSLFKINGRRVFGVEIEKVALEACDKFRFAKAILVSDEDRDRSRIVLFIELDRSCWENNILRLETEVQDRLAQRMKMLSIPPKEIIFARHIPRTSNGKLNLPMLKQIWKIQSVRPIEKTIAANLNLFSIDEEITA